MTRPVRFRPMLLLALAGVVSLALPSRAAESLRDPRMVVTLPGPVAQAFLAEMRGHMRTLDDIMMALADGDYAEAADVADVRLDFGSRVWAMLAEQGMSDSDLAALKERMRAQGFGPGTGGGMGGGGMGPGMGGGGRGMGFGRYMPPAVRSMGQAFHAAGGRFAEAARAMPETPSAADLQTLLEALRDVTATCRACHDAVRIEAGE